MKASSLPVYKIIVPITKHELTLNVMGDWHYGLRHVSREEIIRDAKKENEQHRGNLFRIYTGDMIENALKTSVGHNYDISIPDPQDQKDGMKGILEEISLDLYGKTPFKKLKEDDEEGQKQAGCTGNHEYRSRKQSGIWIDRDIYKAGKILSVGIQGILELTIINKKLKLSKVYRIYFSHRPSLSNATALSSIVRAMHKKRADVPGCDVYIFGHFHKRILLPDGHYDSKTGKFKKVLYVVNPSPAHDIEYADVANFSPLVTGYHVNCYLPLDPDMGPRGIV